VPLAIGDPLLFIEDDGRAIILTSLIEKSRIAATLPDAEILEYDDFGWRELRDARLS
jgi:hypothetical protein